MPITTLEQVIAELDALIDWSRRTSSRVGFFAAIYRSVSLEVQRMAAAGEFNDVDALVRLDVDFANRYFAAVQSFRRGDRPSRSWGVALSATSEARLLIVQHLVLGMNAHINFDLGVSAAQSSGSLERLASLAPDFQRVTGIFPRLIADIERRIGDLSPLFGELDALAGRTDEQIVGFSIQAARERAWENAQVLLAGHGFAPVLIQLQDGLVASFGQALRNPLLMHALSPIRQAESNDVPMIIAALSSAVPA